MRVGFRCEVCAQCVSAVRKAAALPFFYLSVCSGAALSVGVLCVQSMVTWRCALHGRVEDATKHGRPQLKYK